MECQREIRTSSEPLRFYQIGHEFSVSQHLICLDADEVLCVPRSFQVMGYKYEDLGLIKIVINNINTSRRFLLSRDPVGRLPK